MFELLMVYRRAFELRPVKLEKEKDAQMFMDIKRLWKEACVIRDVLQLKVFPKIYIEPNFGRLCNQGNGLHISKKFYSVIFLKDLSDYKRSYNEIIFYLAHEMFHQYQAENQKPILCLKNGVKWKAHKRENEIEADAFALAYCEILGLNCGCPDKNAFLPPKVSHALYDGFVTYDKSDDGERIPLEVRCLAEKYKTDFGLTERMC